MIALHSCFPTFDYFLGIYNLLMSLIVNYLTAYITQFHLISFMKLTEHTYIFQLEGEREKEKKTKYGTKKQSV